MESNVNTKMKYLTDVFSGADGGVKFIKFRFMMEDFERENSVTSNEVIKIFNQFIKLVEASEKYPI